MKKLSDQSYNYVGSGGISLGSCYRCCNFFGRDYSATVNFDASFVHTVYGSGDPEINIDFDFNYVASAGKLYWYRVLLYCQEISESQDSCSALDDVSAEQPPESININPIDNSETYCSKVRMRTRPILARGTAETFFSQINEENDNVETPAESQPDLGAEYVIKNGGPCDELQEYTMVDMNCAQGKPVLLTVVMAQDLDDLCKKLRTPLSGPSIRNFKICSVTKFITPVNESAGHGVKTELERQDVSNISSCMDYNYNLDFNLTNFTTENLCNNRFVFHSFAKRVFYNESNLIVNIKGESVLEYTPRSFNGFIIFDAAPSVLISNYYKFPDNENYYLEEISADALTLEGSTEFLINPLVRYFLGGLELGENFTKFISPYRKYESLIKLKLNSLFFCKFSIKFNSCKNIHLSSLLQYSITDKYNYSMSLSMALFGSSKVVSNKRVFISSGYFSFSLDRIEVISKARSYRAQGTITLSGLPNAVGKCYVSEGVNLQISGTAHSAVSYGFRFTGGLVFSSVIAGVVVSNRKLILSGNNMNLAGKADINFTNFGLLVSNAIFYSLYSNASIDVAEREVDDFPTRNQETISICGCEAGSSIYVDHNLSQGGVILDFLNRNKFLKLDSRVYLSYKSRTKSWTNTQVLLGFSQTNSQETTVWRFIFELSCTNIIENEIFDENYLKFNFFVRKQSRTESVVSNLLVYINPNQICKNGILSAVITRPYLDNEHSLLVDSIPVSTNFYKIIDKIGIFSSDYWNRRLNYSALRPSYYSTTETRTNPSIIGIWPEFRINFGNTTEIANIKKIKIENPTRIDL